MPSADRPSHLLLPDGGAASGAWALDPTVLHLNHGSYGAVPRAALDARARLSETAAADPVGWFVSLPGRMASARAEIAPFLGIPASACALVVNASAGASAIFGSLPHAPGGEIVVTDHGYGAVVLGAERLARRWGGRVRTARVPLSASADEAAAGVEAAISPRTRLVVIDQITSPTARMLPVERIAVAAARSGAEVLVDGAHAPGTIARPVPDANVSWVANLHKFACAPPGSAVIVPSEGLRDVLFPTIDSWGATLGFPERFDHQGTLDAAGMLAAPVAVSTIEALWGWRQVREHAVRTAAYAAEHIGAALAAITGEDHAVSTGMPVGTMTLVRLPGELGSTPAGAHAVRDRLKEEHRAATAPTCFDRQGYLRLSAHAYTTAEQIEEFAERAVPALVRWARDKER